MDTWLGDALSRLLLQHYNVDVETLLMPGSLQAPAGHCAQRRASLDSHLTSESRASCPSCSAEEFGVVVLTTGDDVDQFSAQLADSQSPLLGTTADATGGAPTAGGGEAPDAAHVNEKREVRLTCESRARRRTCGDDDADSFFAGEAREARSAPGVLLTSSRLLAPRWAAWR